MVNQEPQPGATGTPAEKPSDHFSVRVENPSGIYGAAEKINQKVSDRYDPENIAVLSATTFLHPLIRNEVTVLEPRGLAEFELESTIHLSKTRQAEADAGYFSDSRVATIQSILEKRLPSFPIKKRQRKPLAVNILDIETPDLIVHLGFGYDSLETRRAALEKATDNTPNTALFVSAFIDSPNWYETAQGTETMRIVSEVELTTRLDQYAQVYEALFRALGEENHVAVPMIPIVFKPPEETQDPSYADIHNLIDKYPSSRYRQYKDGYFYFGSTILHAEDLPAWQAVLQRSRALTPREEQQLYNDEEDRYKLHLQVPSEQKLQVLEALLKANEQNWQPAPNPSLPPSLRPRETYGDKYGYVGQWKMLGPGYEKDDGATFVFYGIKTNDEDPRACFVKMVRNLMQILEPLNLPEQPLPRYSAPVITRLGRTIPYASYVQGNGDFKKYLEDPTRGGSREKLAQFYDASRNFAVRPETTMFF